MSGIHVSCSDLVAEIGNLLDGEVSAELRAQLEAHLAICKHCMAVYDSTRKTIRIVAGSETFELSAAEIRLSTDEIMTRIRRLGDGTT